MRITILSLVALLLHCLLFLGCSTAGTLNAPQAPQPSMTVSPGLYLPVVQTSNVTSPIGCSNDVAGIVATTAGANCTFSVPIDSVLGAETKWYVAVKLKDGGDSTAASWSLKNSASSYSSIHGSVGNMGSPTMGLGLGDVAQGMALSYVTGAPSGAEHWQVVDGDQTNIYVADVPIGSALTKLWGGTLFKSTWDGAIHTNTEPFGWINSYDGSTPFLRLNSLTFTTNSMTSVIESIVVSTTGWNFPADGKGPPLYYEPTIAGCQPINGLSSGNCAQVIVSPGYGKPSGTVMVNYHHPNASEPTLDYPVMQPSAALLYNNGYSFMEYSGVVGTGGNYTTPTASSWGSRAGNVGDDELVDTVFIDLPSHNQLMELGLSMGCENSLVQVLTVNTVHSVEVSAIACYSGVHDLVASDAFPVSGGFAIFDSIIRQAYGPWFLADTAKINDNPATGGTGNWTLISTGASGPSLSYMEASAPGGTYVWKDEWANSTTYATGDIVSTPYTGSITPGLDAYNPAKNWSKYVGIPILDNIAMDDPYIDPSQVTTFAMGVGGTVTQNNITETIPGLGGKVSAVINPTACGHLGSCLFDPSQLLSFFNGYRTPKQ